MSTKMLQNRSNFKDLYPKLRYTFRELRPIKHRKSFAALLKLNSEIHMSEKRFLNLDLFFSEVDRKAMAFIDSSPTSVVLYFDQVLREWKQFFKSHFI